MRYLAIILTAFVFLAFSPAYSKTPNWIWEFRSASAKVQSEDSLTYAKLGASIATKHRLEYQALDLTRDIGREQGSGRSDRLTIIIIRHRNTLWCVCGRNIFRTKSEREAIGSLWDIEDAIPTISPFTCPNWQEDGQWKVMRRYRFPPGSLTE